MYGKTFSENDSVHSHSEESIKMLEKLASESRGNSSTIINGVTPQMLRLWIQHIRESIEAYRDLCDELEDDKDETRQKYEEKVVQFFNRFMNADLTDETNYRTGELARLVHQLDNRVGELDNHCFELNTALADEREKSTQLEQRIKVLTAERDLAKKLAKQKSEELKRQLNEKYGTVVDCMELKAKLDKKCREVGELTKELEYEHEQAEFWRKKYMSLREVKEQSPAYWKAQFERMQKKYTQLDKYCGELETEIDFLRSEDTDSAEINNPCNFCGNCRHYAQMGKDDGDFEGICTQHYIKRVDPDDASCKHFKPTYDTRVVIGKPEFPVCEKCNHEDCSNCTLCPF